MDCKIVVLILPTLDWKLASCCRLKEEEAKLNFQCGVYKTTFMNGDRELHGVFACASMRKTDQNRGWRAEVVEYKYNS